MFAAVALLSLPALAAAATCTAAPYYNIAGWPRSDGCIPTGFFQTGDLGNTSPTDAQTRCEQQCTSFGTRCVGYLAQVNKAADSNLYSGTCFFYGPGALPSQPRSCADKPTLLLGGTKDDTRSCFSSSAAVATAFCSSYLSYGIVTSYTSTFTPVSTSTSTYTSSVFTTITTDALPNKMKRVVTRTLPAPSCLATQVPPAQLTDDCKCLTITSSTTRIVSTAATSTKTTVVSTTKTFTTYVTPTGFPLNGGFEVSLSPWNYNPGTFSFETSGCHAGTCAKSTGGSVMASTVGSLLGGRTYLFTAWAKSTSGPGCDIAIAVTNEDQTGNEPYYIGSKQQSPSADWQTISATFTTGATGKVQLQLGPGCDSTWWDDVTVTLT